MDNEPLIKFYAFIASIFLVPIGAIGIALWIDLKPMPGAAAGYPTLFVMAVWVVWLMWVLYYWRGEDE